MPRSSIWKWYAEVNDDIRNKVIEEGWSGRQTEASTFQNNVAAQEGSGIHSTPHTASAAGVRNPDPYTPAPLQGIGHRGADDANPESTKQAVESFYGLRQTPDGDELGQSFEDERKLAQEQEAVGNFESVYGRSPQQSDAANIYGHTQDQEPEQEL